MNFGYDTDTVGAGLPAKRPLGLAQIPDQSAQLIAKLPRRHPRPAFERPAEAAGVGEPE
jgi:hypothetical protein